MASPARIAARREKACETFRRTRHPGAWAWLLILDAAHHALQRDAVARCGCGRAYPLKGWRRLPLNGVQSFPDCAERLEMRTCACGSTSGLWIDIDGNLTAEPLG